MESSYESAKESIIAGLERYRKNTKEQIQNLIERIDQTDFRTPFLASFQEGYAGFEWNQEPFLNNATSSEKKGIYKAIRVQLCKQGLCRSTVYDKTDLADVFCHHGTLAIVPCGSICKEIEVFVTKPIQNVVIV